MAISSLLDIGWAHAFWTEGPRFTALGLSDGGSVAAWPDEIAPSAGGGGGLIVGAMSLTVGTPSYTTTNHPDAVQATSGARPIYRASSASFNSQPIVEFDGTDDFLATAQWPPISSPYEVFVIARLRSVTIASGFRGICGALNSSTRRQWIFADVNPGGPYWANSTANIVYDGTANTTAHTFNLPSTTTNGFLIDGVAASNTSGTSPSDGVVLGALNNNNASSFGQADIVFWGIKAAALTSGEKADLVAYAQSTYGTP